MPLNPIDPRLLGGIVPMPVQQRPTDEQKREVLKVRRLQVRTNALNLAVQSFSETGAGTLEIVERALDFEAYFDAPSAADEGE